MTNWFELPYKTYGPWRGHHQLIDQWIYEDTFQELHIQLINRYKESDIMNAEINKEMAAVAESTQPKEATEGFAKFVQTEADVGKESEETRVN